MAGKCNFAAFVNINTPSKGTAIDHIRLIYTVIILILFMITLAPSRRIGIIIVTYETCSILFEDCRCQDADSPAKRNPQPACDQSPGPFVCGGELLRPPGPDSGQIRDAAPGREGSDADQRRRHQLRLLPPRILQSAAGFYPRRDGGPYSATSRPQGGSQADQKDPDVCRANSHSAAVGSNTGIGATDPEGICYPGSSQNSGAGSGVGEKKTEQSIVGEPGHRHMLPAAMLTDQYEMLRSYVLARNCVSGLRLGQGTLMARGTANWMQVAGELIPPAQPAAISCGEMARVPLPMQDEVIRLMGAAVISLVCGGSL